MSTSQPGVDGRSYDLLDAIPRPVYVWRRTQDGAIRLAFANAEAHRETRGQVRSHIGGEVRELSRDDTIAALVADTMRDGQPRQLEHEYLLHSTGELRWFRTWFMRSASEEVVALNEDLTDRRRAETELEASEARFRHLLERAPAIVCILRAPDHVYEMANEECRRALGRDDLVGRSVAEVMPEIAAQGLLRILDDVIATGQPFVARAMPVPIRQGRDLPAVERHFDVVVQPITEADGTRSGTFVHCFDVTDLVHAVRAQETLTAELRASQERHELVLRATHELLYDWDIEANAVFYSDALHSAFGYRRDQVEPGFAWWAEHVHPDDRAAATSSLDRAMERGENLWAHEYRFRRADGTYAIVLDRAHLLLNDQGQPTRLIGSMVDISERRRLEIQLRESQKMEAVGRLAGGVAHDFNNLLSAIIGYADLAMMDTTESSAVREEIEEIRKAAHRAAQLTRQLLAVGRRQIRRPTQVDVDVAVHETDRLLTQLLGERIRLAVRTEANGALVHMDPGELDQVLVNLAVNARDAMPDGGEVTIETSCCVATPQEGGAGRPHVLLSVSDTGSGIDARTMPHIFEPFFTTKGDAGTGLGLSTVYGIVEQAGGRIEVDTTLGKGTRFRILFPAAEEPRPASEPPEASTPSPARAAATVLLVEDESGVRALARKILARAGFRVVAAEHGVAALRAWEEHAGAIDAVVTDVVMPEMGGRALAEALRARRPDLPILFMSGYSDDEDTRRDLADMRIAFLPKPFSAETLVRAMRELLRGVSA